MSDWRGSRQSSHGISALKAIDRKPRKRREDGTVRARKDYVVALADDQQVCGYEAIPGSHYPEPHQSAAIDSMLRDPFIRNLVGRK